MTVRILFSVFALTVTALVAQTPLGEIAGRMTDEQHSALPGTRIRITNENHSREVVTDRDGRFLAGSLPMGSYSIVAELAGFKATSGAVTISLSTPRAFLAWSLRAGCLTEIQRVIQGPKVAARSADAIVHMRVARNAGPLLISVRPDCEGRVFQEYSVEVLDSASIRGDTSPSQRQVIMEAREPRLTPGHEYIALLWPDGSTTHDLVIPILSGRLVSPSAGELHGLGAKEALNILAKWSEERQR